MGQSLDTPASAGLDTNALTRTSRTVMLLAFSRARGGIMGWLGLGAAVLTTLVCSLLVGMAQADPEPNRPAVALVPGIAAHALVWGAGVLCALASAAGAYKSDAADGLRDLLRMRGIRLRSYAWLRLAATSLWLFLVCGIGTTVITALACFSAKDVRTLKSVLLGGTGALVYVAAFALLVGALAFAAFSAKTRGGGYLSLVLLLGVPELLSPLTAKIIPEPWTSIPSALAGLRSAFDPFAPDAALAFRALLPIALYTVLLALYARIELARALEERP